MKYLFCTLFCSFLLQAQEEKEIELKANNSFVTLVMEWRNSEKIKNYIKESPELEIKVNDIILKGLNGHLENNGKGAVMSFAELFTDGLIDLNYDLALDFLSDAHIGAIEGAYDKIVNHPKNSDVANVILKHMNRYKEKLSREIEQIPGRKN